MINYIILMILNIINAAIFYLMYYAYIENGQIDLFKTFFVVNTILSSSSFGIYFMLTSKNVSTFLEERVSQTSIKGLPVRPRVALLICCFLAAPCALVALFVYMIFGTIDLWMLRGGG